MTNTEELLNFPERVQTGNGYANDLTATTNDRLGRTIKSLVYLSDTYKEENKSLRKSIKNLEDTIRSLDKKNGKLQYAIFVLTIVTVITALVEVYLAFKK